MRLDLPTAVQTDIDHGWFLVQPRNAWTVGGKDWPGDCLLGIRLDAFLAGSRDFTLLFEPGKRRILNGHGWNAGRLILSILDNLAPVFEVLTPTADGWARTTLPGLPSIGVVDVWSLDVEIVGDQWRAAGQRAGSADAILAHAARARQGAGRVEALASRPSRPRDW